MDGDTFLVLAAANWERSLPGREASALTDHEHSIGVKL